MLSPMTLRSRLKRQELLELSDAKPAVLLWYWRCDGYTEEALGVVFPTLANLQPNNNDDSYFEPLKTA